MSSPSFDEPLLLGFIAANIVGLRYYSGTITTRELVALDREPLNPFDTNAIKVLNTRSQQVGHIQRDVAAVLSPLLDSSIVFLEAIVPLPPPKNRSSFRLPCQIYVFARPHAFDIVRATILSGGLQLVEAGDHEFLSSDAVVVKERNSKGKKPERSVDDIFALLGKNNVGEIASLEPPRDVIRAKLFDHQKEGLGWMVARENSGELPPFWEIKNGEYVNVLTNYQTTERPESIKGGIFADDMGLGKTLTLLSLIAYNRPSENSESSAEKNLIEGASLVGRKSKSRKQIESSSKRQKLDGEGGRREAVGGPKTTLVVCPPSVFSSWITQLEEHTVPGSLKVYMYHGDRIRDSKKLLQYDIVMTTYSTLSSEFNDPDSPMKDTEWLRVILDEAHLIKNFAAQQTKAVISLKAARRWVVTGTPIQNSSSDLFSLMAFLKFEPFSIKCYWQSLVQRPLDQGKKSGMSRLQALIATICLRRTKDVKTESLVGLPSKTIETFFVDLSAEEREPYDQLESEAQNTIREYIDTDSVLRNYSTVLHIILRLRQICNDAALCPSDIKTLLSSNTLEDVSENPQLLQKLASLVEDGDDFDCPVCLCPPSKTVITRCTHIFCHACILKTLKQLNACCPICRHPLSKEDLFSVPPSESSNDDESKAVTNKPLSSKVAALMKFLLETKKENPSTKSVVFSQFRKMLILLEEPLKAAGFVILRLDGSLSMKARSEVINAFSKEGPGAPSILLASLKAAGAGINLTAASRVYLLEPWWNPAVEEQAMDRVHRIGQKEDVKIVRMIVKNSIEERILELQERKKKLASGALGRRATKEQREKRVEDVRVMIGL